MAFRPRKCLLHHILRDKNFSPSDLSLRTGYSVQEISDYANNRKIMSLGTAVTFYRALGVSADELYEYEWKETRKRSRRKPE